MVWIYKFLLTIVAIIPSMFVYYVNRVRTRSMMYWINSNKIDVILYTRYVDIEYGKLAISLYMHVIDCAIAKHTRLLETHLRLL